MLEIALGFLCLMVLEPLLIIRFPQFIRFLFRFVRICNHQCLISEGSITLIVEHGLFRSFSPRRDS